MIQQILSFFSLLDRFAILLLNVLIGHQVALEKAQVFDRRRLVKFCLLHHEDGRRGGVFEVLAGRDMLLSDLVNGLVILLKRALHVSVDHFGRPVADLVDQV